MQRLGEILVDKGIISNNQLVESLNLQKENHLGLGEILVNGKFATEEDIMRALAFQQNVEYVDLDKEGINSLAARLITENLARMYTCIPIDIKGNNLVVAMDNPSDIIALKDLEYTTKHTIIKKIANKSKILMAIDKSYGQEKTKKALDNFQSESTEIEDDIDDEVLTEESSPVIQLVNGLIETANALYVSDIHIEPTEKRLKVRFRLDGQLYEHISTSIKMLNPVINRIKVMADMKIEEKRTPQDGRIAYKVNNVKLDLRVSTLPTIYGEKVVMRLLQKAQFELSLKNIGLSSNEEKDFSSIMKRPHGVILVCGPTGSGKSTTLYTVLSLMNSPDVNLTTIEDPVEYNIEGINQVNVDKTMGFAEGLRTMLRQDPDVIMIGEIRDRDTADIAIRAALTGHLVLSTIHTNSAASTLTRLVDMGVASYLLSSTVSGIVSQRLVRKICPHCKEAYDITKDECEDTGIPMGSKVYKGIGCKQCNNTGFKGRMAIFELLRMDRTLAKMFAKSATEEEIESYMKSIGTSLLADAARNKVIEGTTTVGEFRKVAFSY